MSFLLLCFSSAKSPLTSTLSFPLQTFLLHTFLLDVFLLNTFPRFVRSQFRSIPHQRVRPSGRYRRINRCHSDVHNRYCFCSCYDSGVGVLRGGQWEDIVNSWTSGKLRCRWKLEPSHSSLVLRFHSWAFGHSRAVHVLHKVQLHACITWFCGLPQSDAYHLFSVVWGKLSSLFIESSKLVIKNGFLLAKSLNLHLHHVQWTFAKKESKEWRILHNE